MSIHHLPGGFLAWFFPWFITVTSVRRDKEFRGYIGRLLRLLPFLRRRSPTLIWLFWWNLILLPLTVIADADWTWMYVIDIARAFDDLANHDDDTFRRFFEGARNRVKWKMKVPAPARQRTGTG